MDWNKLDMESDRYACLIDPYTLGDLLLQVSCNVKDINEDTVKAEIVEALIQRQVSLWDVWEANKGAIVAAALRERGKA